MKGTGKGRKLRKEPSESKVGQGPAIEAGGEGPTEVDGSKTLAFC